MAVTDFTPGAYRGTYRGHKRVFVVQQHDEDIRHVRLRLRRGISHTLLATVDAAGLHPTDDGRDYETAIADVMADPAGRRIEFHCLQPGCGRVLTARKSIETHYGPEHRNAAATPARLTVALVAAGVSA